jgi:hypothetical protein
MVVLGISAGQKRSKPKMRIAIPWSNAQTSALLGALGADATIESIAVRTGHSVKSVRAKIARLDYQLHELHGFATFTVSTLAALLRVTPRQIRRWKERGWLETNDRRITEECLGQFLSAHSDQIQFESLPKEDQVYLVDLGFPSQQAATFKKNIREILDGIGRQRNPRRRIRRGEEADGNDDSLTAATSA